MNIYQFYRSKEWEHCKYAVLNQRTKNDGVLYCEHCHLPIVKGFNPQANNNSGAIVFHHKIFLNNINVNDASISLNPDNIMVVHWRCHNEIHERFGFGTTNNIPEKKVYLVTGAACSGKTTWVKERVGLNDIIVDIDDIWQMVTGQERYIKPNAVKPIVFKIRDELKGMIARGTGTWRNAFIIESLPSVMDREREADKYKQFNVEVVTMPTTKKECIERLWKNPEGRNLELYQKYINEYYERFRE